MRHYIIIAKNEPRIMRNHGEYIWSYLSGLNEFIRGVMFWIEEERLMKHVLGSIVNLQRGFGAGAEYHAMYIGITVFRFSHETQSARTTSDSSNMFLF